MKRRARPREIFWLAAAVLVAMGWRPARAAVTRAAGMLTLEDLRELARSVGFMGEAIDVAAAVAMAESGGVPHAANIVTAEQAAARHQLPERSFGLWQVNVLAHPEYDETRLREPDYSARAAFLLSNGGTNWSPWSTYTHGLYRRFMPSERSA